MEDALEVIAMPGIKVEDEGNNAGGQDGLMSCQAVISALLVGGNPTGVVTMLSSATQLTQPGEARASVFALR